MAYVLVRHTVTDYGKWKPIFDQHGEVRQQFGFKHCTLFRNANNPNELVMLFETDDLNKAREFMQLDDLRQAMQRGGVIDQPTVLFLEKIEDFAH